MVGSQIREIREAMGLRISDLAELVGVSRPYLSRVERGSRNATPGLVQKIDAVAAEHGIHSTLSETIGIEDETVRQINRFLLDPKVSEAKKAAIRRMVHVLIRME